jgi:hypothetical protein
VIWDVAGGWGLNLPAAVSLLRTILLTALHAMICSRTRVSGHLHGTEAPKDVETNRTPKIPGNGWFTLFRLYGPTKTYFNSSWATVH